MVRKTLLAALLAIALVGSARGQAATTPLLTDLRLGDHDGVTRVVLDFDGGAAPFGWRVAENGLSLTIFLHADAPAPTLPRRGLGPVRAVESHPDSSGTVVTISMAAPIAVAGTGSLAPNETYRHHRLYFDLARAASLPKSAKSGGMALEPGVAMAQPRSEAAQPPAERMVAPAPVERTVPAAPAERMVAPPPHVETVQRAAEPPSHANALEYTMADKTAHEDAEEDSSAAVKLGGAAERSFADRKISAGPALAVQSGFFHDAFELELGGAALFDRGQPSWNSGLLIKKPFELTHHLEFELGAGPSWTHTNYGDGPHDSAGAEAISELVYWAKTDKRWGFYLEGSYGREFSKGHESESGLRAGLLVGIP